MTKVALTPERVRDVLDYDPETGIFLWRKPVSTSRRPGDVAGFNREKGYRLIMVDKQKYQAQRLAWFYVYGKWPESILRFKDNDPQNCRIDNLTYGEFQYSTPEGRRQYDRAHRKRHPDQYKDADLKKYFGINLEEYREKLRAQKGVCAICGEPETAILRGQIRSLAVDHHHDSGQIRDLLCMSCNSMVGYARENPVYLRAAAEYLERHARAAIRADNVIVPLPRKERA